MITTSISLPAVVVVTDIPVPAVKSKLLEEPKVLPSIVGDPKVASERISDPSASHLSVP